MLAEPSVLPLLPPSAVAPGATTGVVPYQLVATRVDALAARLHCWLPASPVIASRWLTARVGTPVCVKVETRNPIRCFKLRGALSAVLALSADQQSRGVITASAGNHGQGVAYAAHVVGIEATIVVPEGATGAKVRAMRQWGAKVVSAGATYDDASAACIALQQRSGAHLVHAFDDVDVIAGQATVASELVKSNTELDTLLVPVGGGGLLAGVATYLSQVAPRVRVVGVEPVGAASMSASLAKGHPVSLPSVSTIADGLATQRPGNLPFALAQPLVDDVLVVNDDEILEATRLLFEHHYMVAEPAGAAGLAALLFRYGPRPGERVGFILSGGNVASSVFARALAGS